MSSCEIIQSFYPDDVLVQVGKARGIDRTTCKTTQHTRFASPEATTGGELMVNKKGEKKKERLRLLEW